MVVLITAGCQADRNPCSLSENVLKNLYELDSLIKIPEARERERQGMRANYDEPSMFDAKTETYRFILSSSTYSKVVRIEELEKKFFATIKEIERTTGDPKLTPSVNKFELSKSKWDSIVVNLKNLDFWTYTTSIDRQGLDGSSWSISGYKPLKDECTLKNFHVVSRWSPKDTSFIAMCKLFSELK